MKVMPPREIMKYVSFNKGEPIPKEGMPEEYRDMFDSYKAEYIKAKNMQKSELLNMGDKLKKE